MAKKKEVKKESMTLDEYLQKLQPLAGANPKFEEKTTEEKLYYLYSWSLTVNAQMQQLRVVDQMALVAIMSLKENGGLIDPSTVTNEMLTKTQEEIAKIFSTINSVVEKVREERNVSKQKA